MAVPAVAPRGLVALDAPPPSPRQFTLLDAATLLEPEGGRWLAGAGIGGYIPGPVSTFDPCSSGTNRVKPEAKKPANPEAGAFVALLPATCTAQSVGPDPTFWTDRLEQAFKAYEATAVERVMVDGDGHGGDLGAYLGNENMEVLGTGAAVDATRALELLETEIATHGTGLIHAAPAVATAWAAQTLISPAARGSKVMTTALGTPVAVGAGYIGAVPDGLSVGTDEEWAFASGPVVITRAAEIRVYPDVFSQSLDRSTNDVLHIAERPYLINWVGRQDTSDDDHTQAGVLVDLTA